MTELSLRTARAPEAFDVSTLTPIAHQFIARATATPAALAFDVFPSGARVASSHISWGDWCSASRALALRMLQHGVARGDRVVVLAGNRPLWPIVDLAIQMIGAIGVGIYPTSSTIQVTALIDDAQPTLAFASGEAHIATMREAVRQSTWATAQAVTVVGEFFGRRTMDADVVDATWDQWLTEGAALIRDDAESSVSAELDVRLAALSLDDVAALIYTSGSTGVPKGACISHRYLAASARSIAMRLEVDAADRTLSFLPYSHAAERVFGQCTRIGTGMSTALLEDPTDIFPVARVFRPTLFGGLPRVFERLYEAAEVAQREGRDPREAIADRVGDRVRIATSGGAAMPISVATALQALGLPILGAYGQTEHLCVAMNQQQHLRFDTVGVPMPGTVVACAADGELLVERGALTFSGYWRKPDETAAAFTPDGVWLRTGDLADIDADGALHITGRVKELIALSTGRKVAPLPIEAALTSSPYIAHAVCYGEGKKYVVALVSLRRSVVESWAREQGHDLPWAQLAAAPSVRSLVERIVSTVNEPLSKTDRIQHVAITDREFTVEGGELTPTMKVVRRVVAERYATTFEALYH